MDGQGSISASPGRGDSIFNRERGTELIFMSSWNVLGGPGKASPFSAVIRTRAESLPPWVAPRPGKSERPVFFLAKASFCAPNHHGLSLGPFQLDAVGKPVPGDPETGGWLLPSGKLSSLLTSTQQLHTPRVEEAQGANRPTEESVTPRNRAGCSHS